MTVDGLPASVRIGPYDVRFAVMSSEDAESEYAHWDEYGLTIRHRTDYASGAAAVDSIIHELLHAIWYVGALRETDNEEHLCTVYATNLTQVLRDNPEMIEWMLINVKK